MKEKSREKEKKRRKEVQDTRDLPPPHRLDTRLAGGIQSFSHIPVVYFK